MAKIFFISLGCDKNRIDAEIMARRLLDAGHEVVPEPDGADCAVINTCGFIESAKKEAIDNIFNMVREKESGAIRAVVVTGCLSQRYGQELAELIPETDAVVGLCKNAEIAGVIDRVLAGERVLESGPPQALEIEGKRALSTPPHYAYLKIAEGCSNHCTYCAIPQIRGPFRSRPMEAILDEARALAKQGVRELILIAQDTTSYGRDLKDGSNLARLLRSLNEVDGLWKIRVLYAYPDRIDDDLIRTMAACEKVAKYLDIPLQHASREILKRMARFGDSEKLLSLIGRLREAMPEITLRSTFIVGFPGETEEQFLELCEFLRQAKMDRVGCFPFSCEEGTAAERLTPQLDEETKLRRVGQFELLQSDILARKRQAQIGREFEVICDGFDLEREMFACRGEADAPEIDTNVWIPVEADLMPGEIYTVRICGADACDLYGQLVTEPL